MANLTETPTYEAGIYRFETTDPVQGGPGGIDNLPTNQLANRTAWLKAQVEALALEIAAIESGYATAASLAGHAGNTNNPHGVTKAQVGLGSVENYGIATQAESESGTSTTKYMTPLRTKQAIAELVPAATETVAGLIERATAAEAQAMADWQRAITPALLAAALKGVNQALTDAGYQRLPGGLILQWGRGLYGAGTPVTFPLTFPAACMQVVIGPRNFDPPAAAYQKVVSVAAYNATAAGFTASSSTGASIAGAWFALGY